MYVLIRAEFLVVITTYYKWPSFLVPERNDVYWLFCCLKVLKKNRLLDLGKACYTRNSRTEGKKKKRNSRTNIWLNCITADSEYTSKSPENIFEMPWHFKFHLTPPPLTLFHKYSCCWVTKSGPTHFAIPWTAAHQALLSLGFFKQEYWSG